MTISFNYKGALLEFRQDQMSEQMYNALSDAIVAGHGNELVQRIHNLFLAEKQKFDFNYGDSAFN